MVRFRYSWTNGSGYVIESVVESVSPVPPAFRMSELEAVVCLVGGVGSPHSLCIILFSEFETVAEESGEEAMMTSDQGVTSFDGVMSQARSACLFSFSFAEKSLSAMKTAISPNVNSDTDFTQTL